MLALMLFSNAHGPFFIEFQSVGQLRHCRPCCLFGLCPQCDAAETDYVLFVPEMHFIYHDISEIDARPIMAIRLVDGIQIHQTLTSILSMHIYVDFQGVSV